MGEFSDAWDEGQAEKQAIAEADKLEQEVAKQVRDQGVAKANRWFDDVLTPVVIQAGNELQSRGLELQFKKVNGDPVQGSIQISGYANAVSVAIQVYSNGVINLEDTLTNSDERGDVRNTSHVELTNWLKGIIRGMARAT